MPDPAIPSRQPLRLGLQLALVLAILVAGIELGIRWMQWSIAYRPFRAGWDELWMAPLSLLLWLAAAALAATALVALLGRRAGTGTGLVVTVVAAPALTALAWLHPNLHIVAMAVLATGVAISLGRWAERHPERVARLARRGATWAGAVGVAMATAGLAAPRALEWHAMRDLPAGRAGTPNVLLLVLDTVRSYSMSLYGYERLTTPSLDSLAASAVRFDRAFVTAPWTLPSHASMFTGQHAETVETGPRAPLDDRFPTLAEALAEAGYATGGFVANLAYTTWEHGLARGFARYRDYPVTPLTFFTASSLGRTVMAQNIVRRLTGFYDRTDRKLAPDINAEFLDWLGTTGDRPFFAFLNYFDAHHPLLPPAPYDTMFGPPPPLKYRPHPLRIRQLTPEEIEQTVNSYDGAIAYVDAHVGALLNSLRQRGLLDRTLVIITSDHGEHWGDHGRVSHGNSLYRQLMQVPLLVRYPAAFAPGTTVAAPVTLRDLPATVLDVAGIPNGGRFPGASWQRLTSAGGSPVVGGEASLGMDGAATLVTDSLHFIDMPDGEDELYDLERDSLEVRNLATDPAHAATLARLRDSLTRLREAP